MHKYENPMMIDINMIVMLERATGLTGSAFQDKVDDLKIVDTYPEVHALVKRMQEHKVCGPHLVMKAQWDVQVARQTRSPAGTKYPLTLEVYGEVKDE